MSTEKETPKEAESNPVTLPELRKELSQQIAAEEKQQNAELIKLQKYTKLLNNPVEGDKLEEHPFVKGVYYLPISFIEMTLDELFFGQWDTRNFKWAVVANEVVGTIELTVVHPFSRREITRVGTAAIQIMVDAIPKGQKEIMSSQETNAWALDLNNKKPGALEHGGIASLKADCFKNAALSLGKYFGRDINRKFTDNYNPIVTAIDDRIRQLRQDLSEAIGLCQDTELQQEIIEKIVAAEAEGSNTPELYKELLNRIR